MSGPGVAASSSAGGGESQKDGGRGKKIHVRLDPRRFSSPRHRRLDLGPARQRRDGAVAQRRQRRGDVGEARGGERVGGADEFGEKGAVEAVAGAGRVDRR